MLRFFVVLALVLGLCFPAGATTGGPNSFTVLGFDRKAKILYLREEVGGESGEYRLWALDYGKRSAPKITPLEENEAGPAGLEAASAIPYPFTGLSLSGEIRKEGLEAREEFLLHRYDLRVKLSWKGASTTARLVAYQRPDVRLVDAFLVDGCALAIVGVLGKPEETGYELQTPLLLCPK
jgi:hypothetical protein